MRRQKMGGWQIAAVGVVLAELMGGQIGPTMAANETVVIQEYPNGLGLGFEPRSLTSQPGGSITSTGLVQRINHHRPITVSVDQEKSVLPPGSEVVITPNILEIAESERLVEFLSQQFQVTIKTSHEVPPGAYKVEIKVDDGLGGESNMVFLMIEGGR